jgi:hypothetical protein
MDPALDPQSSLQTAPAPSIRTVPGPAAEDQLTSIRALRTANRVAIPS